MPEHLDALPERVDKIERKLDSLSASVDRRFDEVDKRFEEVAQHFVEQREYIEFAFGRLENRMVAGFERLDQRMERLERSAVSRTDMGRMERKLDQFIDSQRGMSGRRHPPRRPKKR